MGAMAYPCQFESGLGRFRPLTEQEEIAQSVRMILQTRRGERPYRPTFGARLDRFAFENMDTTTRNLIRQEVVASLQMWEPRIWRIEVTFQPEPQEGELIVNVQYQLRTSGIQDSTQIALHMT